VTHTLRNILFSGLAAVAFALPAMGARPPKDQNPYPGSSTDTPEIGTGRDALRRIVQEQCVVNWSQHQAAAPCERVYLADSRTGNSGYAVLADRKGGAHYLLIPTQTMAGIDGHELLDPDAPNYFAEAWHARDLAGEGIRINTILPGIFATPPMLAVPDCVRNNLERSVPFPKRMGAPEEYASLALEMCRNVYLNGEDVRLDGAIRMGFSS